jgi:hypothetical protein
MYFAFLCLLLLLLLLYMMISSSLTRRLKSPANSLDHDPGTMLKPKPYLLDPKKRIEKGGGYSPSYQILQLRKLRDARKQGDYATVQLMLKSFKRAVRNDHQEDWQLEDEAHENASTPMDTRRTMKFFTKPTGYTQPGVYVPNHRPEVSMKIAKNGPSTGKGLFMSGGTTPVYNMNDKPEQDEDSWLPTSISVQYDDEETCELAVGMAYPFALPDLQVHLEDDNKLVSKMDHVKQLYDKNNSSVAPSRRASTVQSGAGRKRSFSTRTRLPTNQQQGSGGVQRSQSKQNVHLDEMARIEAAADDYFGF